MQFDIIDITDEEAEKLSVVQMKMLRTAQQKKDELYRKAEKDKAMFKSIVLTSGMKNSTLMDAKSGEIQSELDYQVAVLTDNLIYNMSLNEPTSGDDLGGENSDEGVGYIVDYSLSYNERYVIVRDYYLSIPDPDERMAMYHSDTTAMKYLSSYYSTLYNVLRTYSK